MLKLIIIAVILSFTFIIVWSLMKAAGKPTPVIQDIKNHSDKND